MALLALLLVPGLAEARRRLVVLEFTGPKASDFQADVEKMLKKSNSVIPTKKWDAAAEDLDATKVNEKNVKKVAKKLSIDGVIVGRVEKRGSRYNLSHNFVFPDRSGEIRRFVLDLDFGSAWRAPGLQLHQEAGPLRPRANYTIDTDLEFTGSLAPDARESSASATLMLSLVPGTGLVSWGCSSPLKALARSMG